ncbi:MAG: tetratricopeptide repeat protein [Acidobacteriaceae bacterium]|nr:tetratricopeptide repeat protein [Acidobacteriaceae bacterium]MBV9781956.1 tetratricopeptide repeat protein [Acidobacteriaceae bacterium]
MKCAWLALLSLRLPGPPVTFDKDIAPITYQYCAPCHHAGEVAPFPLLTYRDVRSHAAQIIAVTQRRYMPPWPPEPGYGDFAGERRLTEAQLRLIADWVKQGMPEGKPSDLPPNPHFTAGWQMGAPDLIVKMPQPYTVPAAGGDVFRNFVIPVDLKETKYVRAVELRPGNTGVVHHANIVVDRTRRLRQRDGEDGQSGFPGMDVTTEGSPDVFDPDSHFLFWKPGSVLEPEPEGMSWRLDPGTDLILNLHLQPKGKPELIQPTIGFYFSSRPPTLFPMLLQLEHDGALDIPPGDRNFQVTDELKLPVAVDVLAIYPHAHYVGKQIEAWATLPDGTRRWLIKINDWDINWQAVYTYRHPVPLPAGATLAMRITYDNSSANPRNPSNPPIRVHGGDRSIDEMGHVWLQVLPKKESHEDPRLLLQEALMRRRLEKYPGDFLAHYNLGALCQFRGDTRGAITYYQQALQVQPQNATARNSLAAAFMTENRLGDAIPELQEALRIDPAYLNARYNLARALAANGNPDEAAREYAEFLKQKTDDPDAQAGLGTVLLAEHRYDEALPHFREAARLKPDDADIQTNLGALLAMRGDLIGATQAFENALRINPDHQTARANLARARASLAAQRDAAKPN